jgi:hypothetical protein
LHKNWANSLKVGQPGLPDIVSLLCLQRVKAIAKVGNNIALMLLAQ